MFSLPYLRYSQSAKKFFKIAVPSRTTTTFQEVSSTLDTKPNQLSISEPKVLGSLPKDGEQPQYLQVKPWAKRLDDIGEKFRLPRSVQAVYLRPLRRKTEHGLPVCDVQLRSYSVRNVDFFADFAVRAAYYLKLHISGPVPLPRIIERWTVPRSNFVHKKSQENFERITRRRLLQIKDGDPFTVQVWLAFLRKHAFYGVGMKTNVWQFESLDVNESMDIPLEDMQGVLDPHISHFGHHKDLEPETSIYDLLNSERFSHNKSPLTEG
ncbi:hypothetical protein Egran_06510 [Elaphomyces granulatus]|uniref:Small ribosomal subunit protein uS10m n=1 Tax=Elaphomyces granulatus TaxID=519963 RepID=A0A232LNM3_9EURO|nr:hypothetical protein Egran_06510 [Elaphomyces granulatus]